MPEGTDDPRLSAEGELALARMALDGGDLSHAARHVANAFAADPTLPETHETLTRLAAVAGEDVLTLFPLDEPVYLGTVVARAHLLAGTGQVEQAITLLVSATHFDPTRPWASVAWLEDPHTAARVSAEVLTGQLIQVAAILDDPVADSERAAVSPYLILARHAVNAHPTAADLGGAASAVARRLGAVDEAIAWARRATELDPSMLTWMWLGYAHRSARNVDEAVAAWRQALLLDPRNCALHTDIAEVLASAGRTDEAMVWIEMALRIDPRDGSAYPTACLLRLQRDGDIGNLLALADYVREDPANEHAHRMLAEGCRTADWLGGVPAAGDAVSNVLQQLLAASPTATGGALRVDAPVPPSAMVTFARALPGSTVEISSVPEPDARIPRRPDGLLLWTYHGHIPAPAVPPPSSKALSLVADVAHPRWSHPLAAYDLAVQFAGLDLDDLIGLLAHPPQPPDSELGRALARHEPGLWMRTVQTWACLGLLHHRTDEPWTASVRRGTLRSLAFGLEDWAAEAAVAAMVTAAWVDPGVRADVASLVAERLRDAVEVGRRREVAIRWSLARLAVVTPGASDETLRLAREVLADGDSVPDGPTGEGAVGATFGNVPDVPDTADLGAEPGAEPGSASGTPAEGGPARPEGGGSRSGSVDPDEGGPGPDGGGSAHGTDSGVAPDPVRAASRGRRGVLDRLFRRRR